MPPMRTYIETFLAKIKSNDFVGAESLIFDVMNANAASVSALRRYLRENKEIPLAVVSRFSPSDAPAVRAERILNHLEEVMPSLDGKASTLWNTVLFAVNDAKPYHVTLHVGRIDATGTFTELKTGQRPLRVISGDDARTAANSDRFEGYAYNQERTGFERLSLQYSGETLAAIDIYHHLHSTLFARYLHDVAIAVHDSPTFERLLKTFVLIYSNVCPSDWDDYSNVLTAGSDEGWKKYLAARKQFDGLDCGPCYPPLTIDLMKSE